jgi:subtilisin family serine protease
MPFLLAGLALLAAAPASAPAAAPPPPMTLPGDAAAAGVRAQWETWIVGARPGRAARAAAAAAGARRIGPRGSGAYVVARGRARAFAARLRRDGALVYAHPDGLARSLRAVADDPLSVSPNAWRAVIADPALTPPEVTDSSPLIALVDARMDETHPEFTGGRATTNPRVGLTNSHGTATAAIAAAPANGQGILGVWPGARVLNVPLTEPISCGRSARRIFDAVEAGAAVVNMSYGSADLCYPEYAAIQYAVARGVVAVAASGNEFAEGNPLEFPASLPHVLTVAAVGSDLESSYFSNSSAAVDVSAPGEGILTAVPAAFDDDGTVDGYQALTGTSFAAPMVSAAVAWIRAARPRLSADQAAQVVRLSARDIDREGWDEDTGFGLFSVGAALERRAPPADPTEPNDDLIWIDGRAFERADRSIFNGRRTTRLRALLDRYEDPADVYRITVPGRRRARIAVRPSFGDPALAVYPRGTPSLRDGRALARSRRRGSRTERITLRNPSSRSTRYYVAVRIQPGVRGLDAGYTLTIRR